MNYLNLFITQGQSKSNFLLFLGKSRRNLKSFTRFSERTQNALEKRVSSFKFSNK